MLVHTREYILSIITKGRINQEDELFALMRKTDALAALAATGSITGQPTDAIDEVVTPSTSI